MNLPAKDQGMIFDGIVARLSGNPAEHCYYKVKGALKDAVIHQKSS